jgi:predicted nucleic acid-binding protein
LNDILSCCKIIHYTRRRTVCRDPDDDVVLATALVGKAQVIVTGDKDLIILKSYQEIPIIRPTDFWQFEQSLPDECH